MRSEAAAEAAAEQGGRREERDERPQSFRRPLPLLTCRNREAVEAVGEGLPQLDRVAPLALVVEAVDAVDRRALVVATQQEEVLRVLDLVRQQEADGLKALLAAVDVVAEEEIIGLWREAAVLEEAQQIKVLAVQVAYTEKRAIMRRQRARCESAVVLERERERERECVQEWSSSDAMKSGFQSEATATARVSFAELAEPAPESCLCSVCRRGASQAVSQRLSEGRLRITQARVSSAYHKF